MAIRQHPTKPGWWQIVISQGRGKRQKLYTCQGTRAQALTFEAELRGIPREATDQRLADILGQFLDWYRVNRAARTVSEAENMLPKIIKALGNRHLSLLRQIDYDRYKATRLETGVTKRTINVELSYLRSLLKYARDEMRIPVSDLPKLYAKRQTPRPRITPLTASEVNALLGQLDGDKKAIVQLYALCGLRRTEALTLKRGNIDLQSGLIHVHGKGGKNRVVPIVGGELLQQLTDICASKKNNDWMFTNPKTGEPYGDLKKSLKSAAERAGITKPVWSHLLRHSGATIAIQAGVGLRELQDMLGHTDIRMTEYYTHLSAQTAIDAGRKIAALHATSDMSDSKKPENRKRLRLVKSPVK